MSVIQMSVNQMPINQMTVDQISGDQMSINKIPVKQMSGDWTSVGQMSVDQMSVDQMSVDQMSVDQMSVDQIVFDQKIWNHPDLYLHSVGVPISNSKSKSLRHVKTQAHTKQNGAATLSRTTLFRTMPSTMTLGILCCYAESHFLVCWVSQRLWKLAKPEFLK